MSERYVAIYESECGADIENVYETLDEALEAEGYNNEVDEEDEDDDGPTRSIFRLERIKTAPESITDFIDIL